MEKRRAYDDDCIKSLPFLEGVYSEASPQKRLQLAKKKGAELREYLLKSDPVPYYRSFNLVRVPYPTGYAFSAHCTAWTPYVHIINRLFIVQFKHNNKIKTLLVGPTDVQGSKATPFFKRLADGFGVVKNWIEPVIAPAYGTVEGYLKSVGLRPEDIDYITYDHLHTQDLRKWLGDGTREGYFPNAKLLVTRQEWESVHGLLPIQADWYCPEGTKGIPESKVILLDEDVLLGEGVALIRSTGHTEGNHSIVVRTEEGLMVTSENGVGPDAYAPIHSRLPGISEYAMKSGTEVILNGNTLEHGVNQYVSMVLEKTIAGPSLRNSNFPNIASSSELSWYYLFPVNPR